ncbi:MAG: (2Fe-2S)-binding protein [Mesorhizobium sp.]|uniref:(2Fe-2S)-binding protein n=1 Tax=Mesorhizobium sp. TaxID=1871066 RepID=UPI000FE8C38E|nr:(2Fe-2S)-binding protein [Mesorhizobium sp.]RWI50291.1 MAG: (2Fe-2S)-binding protein [Mesorhizobium sp.]
MSGSNEAKFNRRGFLGFGTVVAAVPLALQNIGGPAEAAVGPEPSTASLPVKLTVNGREYAVVVDPRTTLLDALRENLGLTGSKKGCDHGQCGACTVHRDGERVLSCLTLAAQAEGFEITTIESLSTGPDLHPMQQAFIDHDAFQCGYCTPGQIMSAVACVREGHATTQAEIGEYMSGNLCRCAAYPNIILAIEQARDEMTG